MNENVLAARLDLFQNARVAQLFQVHRRCLSLRDSGINQVADTTIGLLEQQFDELPGIRLRHFVLHKFRSVFHELADRFDLIGRPDAGFLNALEDKFDPRRPSLSANG